MNSVSNMTCPRLKALSRGLCAAIAVCLVCSTPALAQKEDERPEQKTKKAEAVSKQVYEKLTKAGEMQEAKNYSGAIKILDSLKNSGKLTEYELSNVLNYYGFVYYAQGKTGKAIKAYEELMALPNLEPQLRLSTMYTTAQLYTTTDNYSKAIRLLQEWFKTAPNPAPEPYILLAQNYYQIERYSDMIKPIEAAMEVARKRDKPVKEDWYNLLNYAYFQKEDYRKVRDIQKILLASWPKKRYWTSLAGAFTELGEESNLLAAYDAAYTQGFLQTDPELRTMAQLYMQGEVPYKAATLLDKHMESGQVKKNEKNYRLLSQAWSLAQEDRKAIPALTKAASLNSSGDLNVRLATSYLNLGEDKACIKSAQEALRKGSLKKPDSAQITLGMCHYNEAQYKSARAAFVQAAKTTRSKKLANQWIRVIDSDVERIRQLELAIASARRQVEKLNAKGK